MNRMEFASTDRKTVGLASGTVWMETPEANGYTYNTHKMRMVVEKITKDHVLYFDEADKESIGKCPIGIFKEKNHQVSGFIAKKSNNTKEFQKKEKKTTYRGFAIRDTKGRAITEDNC